ncbi:MAG: transposase family protein, partial [Alphaproteobacteria bacterium]|nr:transposase family protein [Alphaproteobacteria bacterium]
HRARDLDCGGREVWLDFEMRRVYCKACGGGMRDIERAVTCEPSLAKTFENNRKVGPRNWLRGKTGDQINALAMATGFNLRKILRWIFLRLLAKWFTVQKIITLQTYTA